MSSYYNYTRFAVARRLPREQQSLASTISRSKWAGERSIWCWLRGGATSIIHAFIVSQTPCPNLNHFINKIAAEKLSTCTAASFSVVRQRCQCHDVSSEPRVLGHRGPQRVSFRQRCRSRAEQVCLQKSFATIPEDPRVLSRYEEEGTHP